MKTPSTAADQIEKLRTSLASLLQPYIVRKEGFVKRLNLALKYLAWVWNGQPPEAPGRPLYEYYDELIPGYKFCNSKDGLWWKYTAPDFKGWRQILEGDVVFTLMAYRDKEINQSRARDLLIHHLVTPPTTNQVSYHRNNWRK